MMHTYRPASHVSEVPLSEPFAVSGRSSLTSKQANFLPVAGLSTGSQWSAPASVPVAYRTNLTMTDNLPASSSAFASPNVSSTHEIDTLKPAFNTAQTSIVSKGLSSSETPSSALTPSPVRTSTPQAVGSSTPVTEASFTTVPRSGVASTRLPSETFASKPSSKVSIPQTTPLASSAELASVPVSAVQPRASQSAQTVTPLSNTIADSVSPFSGKTQNGLYAPRALKPQPEYTPVSSPATSFTSGATSGSVARDKTGLGRGTSRDSKEYSGLSSTSVADTPTHHAASTPSAYTGSAVLRSSLPSEKMKQPQGDVLFDAEGNILNPDGTSAPMTLTPSELAAKKSQVAAQLSEMTGRRVSPDEISYSLGKDGQASIRFGGQPLMANQAGKLSAMNSAATVQERDVFHKPEVQRSTVGMSNTLKQQVLQAQGDTNALTLTGKSVLNPQGSLSVQGKPVVVASKGKLPLGRETKASARVTTTRTTTERVSNTPEKSDTSSAKSASKAS
jgi:hypothetical protein